MRVVNWKIEGVQELPTHEAGFVAAVKNSLSEFPLEEFTNCLTMRQIFQVLRVTPLSGPEGVRAVFNFSLEKGSTLPFAPICTTSKDSLTRILKFGHQVALLKRLGLTTVLTHDDVKILEKYLLCKEESVQYDLFKIQHAGGPNLKMKREPSKLLICSKLEKKCF